MIATTFTLIGSLFAITAYPPAGQKAPGNPEWTSKFLSGVTIPQGTSNAVDADHRACKSANDWALTFDDGSTKHTIKVLDALKQRNVKATFFVIGDLFFKQGVSEENKAVLKRTYEEGHEIALHSWSHNNMRSLTNDEIVAEIVYNSEAIRDIIGVSPKVFRCPFGSIDERVRAILKAMGLEVIFWTLDSNDWRTEVPGSGHNAQTVYDVFTAASKATPRGTISLQHDRADLFASFVPKVLDILGDKFTYKTVAQCIGVSPYDDFIHNVIQSSPTSVTLVAKETVVADEGSAPHVTALVPGTKSFVRLHTPTATFISTGTTKATPASITGTVSSATTSFSVLLSILSFLL